jgi:hypothetical protein
MTPEQCARMRLWHKQLRWWHKFLCLAFGHKAIPITVSTHQSIWGWWYCTRCGYEETIQFDFPSNFIV